jgi:AAA+ superfamily predicted ATPase
MSTDLQKILKTSKKNNHSNNVKNTSKIFILIFIMLLVTPLLFSFTTANPEPSLTTTTTRANGKPEVTVDFSPRDPLDLEEVNITIESILGHEITWATLYVTLIKSGSSRTGNYRFHPINETKWYSIIPGNQNQGNTFVYFYAEVYFDTEDVKTETYNYSVIYQNTWVSSVFSENVNLSYSPTEPIAGTPVNVTINSHDENTLIKLALLRIKIKLPGDVVEDEGGENFTRINSTHLFSLIPGYLANFNVTFWVEAYDDGMEKIISDKINYIVKSPADGMGDQDVIIYVVDDSKKEDNYIKNVPIIISNETWQYEITEHGGFAWPPFALNPGKYEIKVITETEVLSKKINIPEGDQNFTEVWFHFNVAEAGGLIVNFEEFPLWFVNVAFIILILVCPLFYFIYLELQQMSKEKEEEFKRRHKSERSPHKVRPRRTRSSQSQRDRTHYGSDRDYHKNSDNDSVKDKSTGLMGDGFTLSNLNNLWHPGMIINKILSDEEYKGSAITIFSFFILGIFGTTWAPFYPWWMVIFVGIIIGAISYRFPYLALLVLIIFVIPSTGYQHPAFGWLFMMFALIIAICSLFDWRFGFIVFLTIFVSRLGIAFIVPIAAGLLFSIFMGIAVAIASGIFFTFLVTSSDFTILSFFIGPTHKYGFITFSKPHVNNFMPTHFADALTGINNVNLDSMITILHSNYISMIPFIQIIIWTFVVFVFVYLIRKYGNSDINRTLAISIVPSAILILTSTGALFAYDHSINLNTWLLLIGIIGIILSAITFTFFSMELFKEFYLGRTQKMPIGTRIGEMLSLRKTSFKEIGGLRNIKKELKDTMIGPLLRPTKAKEYGVEPPRGIMLFGPPGCGKTLLMRALATELNVEMVGVRCSDVMSKWYGESESMIEKLFQAVKERKPCILFLDEIDAIAKRRDFYSADDVTPRLLSIMLSELDGMDEAAGVIVVGATNKPELVDPALMRPGRFDKIIFIPTPDYRSRIEIFKIHLKNKPVSSNLDIDNLARSTEGYTGADIENLVKEGAMLAMKRSIKTGRDTKISNTDFLKILPRIKPSLTSDMKSEYAKLQLDFERKKYGKEIKLPPTEPVKI